jgi:hypothetical protein
MVLSFLLGIQDGYIALWKGTDPKPVEIFPIKAEMLPDADRKALAEGIRVDSSSKLAQLIEDYLS